MGTPEFAIPSLEILIKNGYSIAGVVTIPDKPMGRGQIIKSSPVKEFALKKDLPILQPENLKDPEFIRNLEGWDSNLFIVVAFRMLPEVIWTMPEFGTFNLHASLLPQYRGAAPINWAIINGETETGATTFFIDKKIDTGKIILRESVSIGPNETAGELHDKLMVLGASLVLETVRKIENGTCNPLSQDLLITANDPPKLAPKILKEDCRINWSANVENIFNHIRGLSPYPAAFSTIGSSMGEKLQVKIYRTTCIQDSIEFYDTSLLEPGTIRSDRKNYIHVACKDGFLSIDGLQIEGKRRMSSIEFLRGFRILEKGWRFY